MLCSISFMLSIILTGWWEGIKPSFWYYWNRGTDLLFTAKCVFAEFFVRMLFSKQEESMFFNYVSPYFDPLSADA